MGPKEGPKEGLGLFPLGGVTCRQPVGLGPGRRSGILLLLLLVLRVERAETRGWASCQSHVPPSLQLRREAQIRLTRMLNSLIMATRSR